MALQTWWMFVLMTFVVSATPGPNMLLVMTTSARHGLHMAVATMAGCMTALLAMMGLSAAGLGALLQAFPAVFDALRLCGAGYLAYLGWRVWHAPVNAMPDPLAQETTEPSPASLPSASPSSEARPPWLAQFRQGLLVAASNPKAILFAAAFFPQFLHADAPQLPQFAILLLTFSVIEIGWYLVYALGGRSIAHHLRRASVMRAFNRMTGSAFAAFAALMASTHA